MWFLLFSLMGTLVGQPYLHGSELSPSTQVDYFDGKLTVDVERMSLGSLLKTIQQKTGIEFSVDQEQYQEPVSLKFDSLSLEDGLKRILNKFNAVMLLDSDSRVTKVIILGGRGQANLTGPTGVGHSIATGPAGSQAFPQNTPSLPAGAGSGAAAETNMSRSSQNEIPKPFKEPLAVQPSSVQMLPQPPAATMVVQPPTEKQMPVMPPTSTMTIQLPNGQTKTITGK